MNPINPNPALVRSGASAPFCQNGIRPGLVKLAQFKAACAYTQTPALREQDGLGDAAVAHVKLFDPCGAATWFITEYDPQTGEAFGLCDLFQDGGELGYLDLEDLALQRGRMGIGIEIDNWFKPRTLAEVRTNRAAA
jgi:hypothetical protein